MGNRRRGLAAHPNLMEVRGGKTRCLRYISSTLPLVCPVWTELEVKVLLGRQQMRVSTNQTWGLSQTGSVYQDSCLIIIQRNQIIIQSSRKSYP